MGHACRVPTPLHPDEVPIQPDLVQRLLADQQPHLADLPMRVVDPPGTTNVMVRLGDDLVVRLPRTASHAAHLERELRWLPWLAPHLPLRTPAPVAAGRPSADHPLPWAVYAWLPGRPYRSDLVADERAAAEALADAVLALRAIDATGGPATGRRPLAELDAPTRRSIDAAGGLIDGPAVRSAWAFALEAPPWDGLESVWRHTDLLAPNLLVDDGRLSAVIDWGGAGVGDPAADLIAAWSVFDAAGRTAFRSVLGPEEGAWARARGLALHQALLIVPYYA